MITINNSFREKYQVDYIVDKIYFEIFIILKNFAKRFDLKKFIVLKNNILSIDFILLIIAKLKKFIVKTLVIDEINSKKLFAIFFKKSRKITININFQLRDELIYHVKKKNSNCIYLTIVYKKNSS